MGRALRERIVGELTRKYRDTDFCVFVDFSGLDVESMGELRQRMRKKGVDFFVTKNSLLKLAMEEIGLPMRDDLYRRPTAVVTGGDDAAAVCKLIVEWQKKTNTTQIKGAIFTGKLLTPRQVTVLATLPPREVLLSQVLGLFVSPLVNIATLISSTLVQFASLLHNHIEKLEKEG